MNDTQKKVVEVLKKMYVDGCNGHLMPYKSYEFYAQQIDALYQASDDVEWISIKDELPPKYCVCRLVYVDEFSPEVLFWRQLREGE